MNLRHGLIALSLLTSSFGVTPSQVAQVSEKGIILIGDTGRDNQGQLDVGRSIEELCQKEKCDLGLLAGDNVYPAGVSSSTDPILQTMFDKYYNHLNIPFLVALGNHDYGKLSRDWVRGSYQIEHSKKNPTFHFPHYFYKFELPEAIVTVLDTSRLMWKKDTDQQAALVNASYIEAREKGKWFLVMGHHPYLSNGQHGNAGNYERVSQPYFISGSSVKKFIEDHVCGKAQFYLSGHDHNLQVFDGNIKGCNTQLIISGAGASGTKLSERNPSQFETSQLGYFHLLLTKDSLRVRAHDVQTKVLFEKNYIRQ